ncbi:MAG: FHA domain-containing protein, partial [Lachnospiraceae bacterium]|nr:FHA domain-containing protein [Lachnospiraceae bacterium]
PISAFECMSCKADISLEKYHDGEIDDYDEKDKEMFIRCPECNEYNKIEGEKFKKIQVCSVCGRTGISRIGKRGIIYGWQLKKMDVIENEEPVQDEPKVEPRTEEDPNSIKCVILTNARDGKEVKIPFGLHKLGAYGDCNPDYFWDLEYIDNEHAIVEVGKDAVFITDNNSMNHTYINRSNTALKPQEKAILSHGDILTLADQDFKVRVCR